MRRVLLIGLFVLAVVQTTLTQQPRTHDLTLTPEHVHWGYYDSRVPPVLRIASGDRVRVETMVAGGLQRLRLAGVAESEIPDSLKAVELGVTERGPGAHPLTGPIFVEGAEPGDTLEVRILAIEFLHPFGVNAFSPGGGVIPEEFPYEHLPVAAVAARRRSCRVLARRVAEARAVLRIDRRGASAAGRKNLESPARLAWWQSRQQGSRGGIHAVSTGARQRRPAVDRRWPRHAGRWRSDRHRAGNVACEAPSKCACEKGSGFAGLGRKRRRSTSPWAFTRISTKPHASPRAR